MENFRSPGFTKPGVDQCLDPPALLTATDAPLAFGMEGDFSLCIAEEIPIPISFQIFTSSLVFQGGLPPAFRRIFALCPAFQRRVGYLPYLRGESGTQGRQWLLLFLHSVGGMCFTSVFSATQANSAAPQRFFVFTIRCAPATQQRQKNVFQMQVAPVPHLCHGKRNANSAAGATTFPLLPHLPHMIFTRLPLR